MSRIFIVYLTFVAMTFHLSSPSEVLALGLGLVLLLGSVQSLPASPVSLHHASPSSSVGTTSNLIANRSQLQLMTDMEDKAGQNFWKTPITWNMNITVLTHFMQANIQVTVDQSVALESFERTFFLASPEAPLSPTDQSDPREFQRARRVYRRISFSLAFEMD